MKKGRHRRFVEARELKRSTGPRATTCAECGAAPEDVHADWCLAEEDRYEEILVRCRARPSPKRTRSPRRARPSPHHRVRERVDVGCAARPST